MKLNTLIEGHEENSRTVTLSPGATVTFLFNFCNKMLVQSICLKVLQVI